MSYSSDAKLEMINVEVKRKCCKTAEFHGILSFLAKIKNENGEMCLVCNTENEMLSKRIIEAFAFLYKIKAECEIIHQKHSRYYIYSVKVSGKKNIEKIFSCLNIVQSEDDDTEYYVDETPCDKPCCKKSFVRGAFLASGSIIHPEKKYHMEFYTYHKSVGDNFDALMKELGLNPKIILRKKSYVIYFKNSDEIADILSMTGVFDTLMDFHNIRIMKDMRNKNNRIINCETANMEKTHMAAIEHILSIQKLKKSSKWDGLSPVLKEIAELRLEYKEASLKDLGEMFTPKLTRSGVNHRLKRLVEIAKNLEGDE